ncbi:hypothetical protein ABPG75_011626 [Micractinium tetrahymenae]
MPRTLLLLLALAAACGLAHAAKEVAVPIDGSMKPGATSLPVIKCPSGFKLSNKDADIVLARQLTDSYFAEIGRPQLLKDGNTNYGCPKGADFVDGDPLFGPISAQALGETKHNSVSVCVPPNRRKGAVVTIYAQSVINYHCKNSPSKPLHIGIVLAKGVYKVGGGSVPTPKPSPPPSNPRCGNGYADTRGVTPIRGSVQPGVGKLPVLSCPPNYFASKADADIVLARKLMDAYFIKMGRAELLKAGNTKYGCPTGADFVDGDPLFPAISGQALGQSKHNSVSVCMPRKTTPVRWGLLLARAGPAMCDRGCASCVRGVCVAEAGPAPGAPAACPCCGQPHCPALLSILPCRAFLPASLLRLASDVQRLGKCRRPCAVLSSPTGCFALCWCLQLSLHAAAP